MSDNDEILSVKEAAERLGVSPRMVLKLVDSGRLPARQVGREWILFASDVAKVPPRKPGRPPKPKPEAA